MHCSKFKHIEALHFSEIIDRKVSEVVSMSGNSKIENAYDDSVENWNCEELNDRCDSSHTAVTTISSNPNY